MDSKPTKQDPLKGLNEHICSHKMGHKDAISYANNQEAIP